MLFTFVLSTEGTNLCFIKISGLAAQLSPRRLRFYNRSTDLFLPFFKQIDYVPFTRPNLCDGMMVMSYRRTTSTPGNLRVMYSEASVLSILILNGHSEEYKVHCPLFNEEMSFTTFGSI